jgi:hypothetical protein
MFNWDLACCFRRPCFHHRKEFLKAHDAYFETHAVSTRLVILPGAWGDAQPDDDVVHQE